MLALSDPEMDILASAKNSFPLVPESWREMNKKLKVDAAEQV